MRYKCAQLFRHTAVSETSLFSSLPTKSLTLRQTTPWSNSHLHLPRSFSPFPCYPSPFRSSPARRDQQTTGPAGTCRVSPRTRRIFLSINRPANLPPTTSPTASWGNCTRRIRTTPTPRVRAPPVPVLPWSAATFRNVGFSSLGTHTIC